MNNNPYTPPQSNVDTKEFKRGKWYIAILAGFLVDVIGTIVTVSILAVLLTMYFMNHGMSAADVRSMFATKAITSPFYLVSNGIGLLFSMLGGYLCARLANQHEYRYAVAIGILGFGLGLIISPSSISLLHHVIMEG